MITGTVWVITVPCRDGECCVDSSDPGHIIGVMDHEPAEGEIDRYLGGDYSSDFRATEVELGAPINVSKGSRAYT